MDERYNPFSPGAGSPPPELAGRTEILHHADIALARIKMGRAERSMFLVGLRGVGKTVLLTKIEEMARTEGYQTIMIEAHENKPLPILLLPHLLQLLYALDTGQMISEKVKRGLRILKSFISGLKITSAHFELSLDINPEKGVADSGDLEVDLTQLFVALGEAAQDRKTGIAILIDEMQYLKEQELSALIMAVHKISQKSLPVIVVGAGLPQLIAKATQSKSYAERLFIYPEIDALKPEDAKKALQEPVESQNVQFTPAALEKIAHITQGYPYFLQEWGYQCWNLAPHSPIDQDTVERASTLALDHLDDNFFRARFDRLTPREKDYLRALAELGSEPQRSGDIAEQLQIDVNKAAPIRNNLIKKGMIYSPTHGDTAFTVPLFEDFMKRVMPNFQKPTRKQK